MQSRAATASHIICRISRSFYPAVALDLLSRRAVGWSMKADRDMSLVIYALMMAVWRRGKADALLITRTTDFGATIVASGDTVSGTGSFAPLTIAGGGRVATGGDRSLKVQGDFVQTAGSTYLFGPVATVAASPSAGRQR